MTKHADPKRIAQHADDLDKDVIPLIKKAGDTLNKDGTYNLEGGDFSPACLTVAGAYPISVQFAFEDIKMLMSTAKDYAARIDKTAETYRNSELHNISGK